MLDRARWMEPSDRRQSGGKGAFDSEPACLSSLLPVVFMLVKESSDLTLQFNCVIQLTHGNRMFKKFALDFRGKIVPLHDDCGAEHRKICSSSLVRDTSSLRSSCGAPFGAPPSLSQRAMALF